MKRFLLMVLTLTMCVVSIASADTNNVNEGGFRSTIDAANTFFYALTQQDIDLIECCVPFRKMAERFDWDSYTLRFNSYGVGSVWMMPSTCEANIVYNETKLRLTFYQRFQFSLLYLIDPSVIESYGNTYAPIPDEYKDDLKPIRDCYDPSAHALTYDLVSILTTNDLIQHYEYGTLSKIAENMQTERGLKNEAVRNACYRLTEYEDILIIFDCNAGGSTHRYVMPLHTILIDDGWYIDPNASSFASILGIPTHCLFKCEW